ncbi:MAG TPA: hypothetical protein VM715_10955, partial [Candidatus Acidoferrum sp.]|nr:hypothetical protein [Candidatus Acidoferrum sp.]
MTASSIGLERHPASRVIGGVVLLRQPSPHANRPIRAKNSIFSLIRIEPHTGKEASAMPGRGSTIRDGVGA